MSASKTRGSTLLASLLLAGAVAGCNLIVGSGDYVIGDAGAANGDSAQVTPNDASVAPVDGTVADAGPLPDGAPPSETGSPSLEAGSTVVCAPDGGAGTVGLQTGSASFKQLVTACVMAESCDPDFFDVPLSECITHDYLEAFPSTACLASAKSCDDFYNCTGHRVADLKQCDGTNTTDTGTCAGAVATTCFSATGGGRISNCGILGGTCATYDVDTAGDKAAGCQVLPSCPDTSSGNHCASSSQIYKCDSTATGTIAIGKNCPPASSCQTDTSGTFCIYNSPSCTTPGATCVDGNLSECDKFSSGNQGFTYRCSVAGLSCVAADAGTGTCLAPGCENSNCQESCDTDTVTMHACVGGAPFAIDCTKYGFTGCSSSTTSSGTLYSYCVF